MAYKSVVVTVSMGLVLTSPALATSPMPPEDQRYMASIETAEDTCGAEMFLENLMKNPRYLSEVQQSSQNDRNVRIVAPNTPVTLDYSPNRLTVIVDREAKTIKMRCG